MGCRNRICLLPVYQQYIENSYRDIEGGGSQAVLYGIFLVIALLLSRYVKDKVRYEVFLRNYLCGIFFLIWIFPFDPNVAIRFGAIGLLSILFMLPMWFSAFSPKDRGLAKAVCVILLAVLYAYNLAVTSEDYYIPYQSVFS
ncbi:MAG: EpsG family protein [Mitsuokella sp.]